MAELDLAMERIQEAPRQWPRYLGGTRRYMLRRFPFFVVFRELDDRMQILAVAHGRRRPGYWLGR
jgi:plasmid stabilization system protein ParE